MQFFPKTRAFVKKHQKRLPAAALLAGLLWDSITLGRPDRLYDNVVLLFYLVLAGVLITVLNRRQQFYSHSEIKLWQLLLLQFSFGNLTSGLFILYGTSGTIAGNWPFLLLLAALLVGNEFLRTRYTRVLYHIAIYYLLVFTYAALIMPVLLKDIDVYVFLISGVLSIIVIFLFIYIQSLFSPRLIIGNWRKIIFIIGAVFTSFNALYFLNAIPPVPLSLKDIGIYHNVVRLESGDYSVSYEPGAWYEFWKRSDSTFHFVPGDSAYCFSSIFAPEGLSTAIYHQWQYFDERDDGWVDSTRVSFPISGGREEGYRSFSRKSALSSGEWRCRVETRRRALVGLRKFEIVESDSRPELVTGAR